MNVCERLNTCSCPWKSQGNRETEMTARTRQEEPETDWCCKAKRAFQHPEYREKNQSYTNVFEKRGHKSDLTCHLKSLN